MGLQPHGPRQPGRGGHDCILDFLYALLQRQRIGHAALESMLGQRMQSQGQVVALVVAERQPALDRAQVQVHAGQGGGRGGSGGGHATLYRNVAQAWVAQSRCASLSR